MMIVLGLSMISDIMYFLIKIFWYIIVFWWYIFFWIIANFGLSLSFF